MTQNILNLKKFNTLGLNAYCKSLEILEKEQDIKTLIKNSNDKFIILGEGSNVILDAPIESPFKVPVFINRLKGISVRKNFNQRVIVRCSAGENWNEFVLWTLENKFGGLECLAGIPGSVGAAPIQNIGAYGSEVCDVIESVNVYDVKRNLTISVSNKDCDFGYRTSMFKNRTLTSFASNFVIVSVDFSLSLDWKNLNTPDYANIKNILPSNPNGLDIANAVLNIRGKKLPDVNIFPNVGSFFINPVVDNTKAEKLQKEFANIPIITLNGSFKLSAAWLIESCGFRGAKYKNVGMHLKHALVLVNYKDSSSQEVLIFAEKVKASVKEKFDVILNMEIVEHVENVDFFLLKSSELLRKNGLMFIATLNKTLKSYVFAIIGAEYLLKWLPIGTHDWNKFLKPDDLISICKKNSLNLNNLIGIKFDIFKNEWNVSEDSSVNYLAQFSKT